MQEGNNQQDYNNSIATSLQLVLKFATLQQRICKNDNDTVLLFEAS